MKKKNYLIDFALKSKYNFFVSLVALLVLIFSVSTITYSWIEGATSISIKTSSVNPIKTYTGAEKAVNVSPDTTTYTDNLDLNQYIDPASLYLAPAKGSVNPTTKNIDVQFLSDDGKTYRTANTNDISNNYVFFEVKIICSDLITSYKFDSSSITVNNSATNSIKTGITVLDSNRNVISSKILSSDDIASNQTACEGFEAGNEYILQFRIWNAADDSNYSDTNAGKEVKFKLTLVPQQNITTLYLTDYTNNETTQNLLSDKVLKVICGSSTITGEKSNNTYAFSKVPVDSLNDIKFVAYNSDETEYKTWDLTGTTVAEESYYNVYGSGLGTFNSVNPITLKDVSAENLLKSSPTVTLNNGTDSYTMYRGSSTSSFLTYVPADCAGKVITFSNSGYYAKGVYVVASPYYYIFGETQTTDNSKTLCTGKWYASANQTTHSITLQDRTKGRAVQNNASNIYVSYNDMTTPYKAYYDSANNVWKITATNTSTGKDGNGVWKMEAYNSDNTLKYYWEKEDRDADTDTTYTFITADEPSATSDGTWGKYDTSDIDPAILAGTKVSFYAGIQNNWDIKGIFIAKGSVSDTSAIKSLNSAENGTDKTKYYSKTVSSITYVSDKFVNQDSYKYNLSHSTGWAGIAINEEAKGGAFYGLNSNGGNNVVPVDSVSATTKINSSDTTETGKASVYQGTASVKLTTDVSQVKSLLGENLTIEYHIKYNSNTDYDYIQKIENITATSNTIAEFDVSAYTIAEGDTFEIATVLTDGDVYYVADRDYVTVTAVPQPRSVLVQAVDNAVVTVTYSDGTIAEGGSASINDGTEITLNAVVDSGYVFTKFEILNSDTNQVISTITTNNSKYTVPAKNIVVKTYVTQSASNYIYLNNAAGWSGTPQAHIWYNNGTSDVSLYSWNATESNMTLVSGNIWKYEIPTDHDYTGVVFHVGDTSKTTDLTISLGKIYNNSTGQWSDYDPSGTEPDEPAESTYTLRGSFNGWSTSANKMTYQSGSSSIVETEVQNLTGGTTYTLKVHDGTNWLSNNGSASGDTTGWISFSTSNSSNFSYTPSSSGTFKFTYDTANNQLKITKV